MKGNLLLVDDEKAIIENLTSMLEDKADKIFQAFNGLEALEIVNKEKIHCILCDINMPKLNGLETIKKVRESGNEVPFIFYTGYGSEELMLKVVPYGAFDFLDKPSLDRIEDVVERGLKSGLGEGDGEDSDFISEYKKLKESMDKSSS